MIKIFAKTSQHFFPDLLSRFNRVPDPRDPNKITYGVAQLILSAVLLFASKVGSRRNLQFRLSTLRSAKNAKHILHLFGVAAVEKIPHGDTVNYFLEKVSPEHLASIPADMVEGLIRKKCFVQERLLGYYLIAIDGSRVLSFSQRHCPNCLTQTLSNGETLYFHPVLEAKLVTEGGMVFSIATEFMTNQDGAKKQDCELKAFYRLAKKLKKRFPQMKLCLLMDSLYPGKRVFSICKDYDWKYLITFKEGSMPAVYREYENLKAILSWDRTPENRLAKKFKDGVKQTFAWVEGIEYDDKHFLNVLECEETKNGKTTRFVWLTNFSISKENCAKLAKSARLRWKIENEGFNMQKKGGYNLEHAYSHDPNAMKNFYFALQIAHAIMQLVEKGSLLKGSVVKLYGSLRNFAERLLIALTTETITFKDMEKLFKQRIQIRLNTS